MPEVSSSVPEPQIAPDLGAGVEAANSSMPDAQPPAPEPPVPAPPASTRPPATLAPVNAVSFLAVPPARLSPVDEFSDISDISRTTSPGRSPGRTPGISMATLPSSPSEPVVLRHDDPSGFFEVILGVTLLAACRAWITRVFQEVGVRRTRIRSRLSIYSPSYDGTEPRHPPTIFVDPPPDGTTDPARCPTPGPMGPIRKVFTDPVIDLPVRSNIRSALLTKALKLFPGPGRKKMDVLETPAAEAPTKAIEPTPTQADGQIIHVQATLVSSSPPATKSLDPAPVPQTPQSKQSLPSGQSRASNSQLQRRGSVLSQPSPSQRVLDDTRDAAPRPGSNTPSGKVTSTSTSLSYVSAPADSGSGTGSGSGEANPPGISSPVPTEIDVQVGGSLIPGLQSSFSAGVSGPTQTQMTLDETSRHLLRNYQAPASVGSSQAVTAVTLTNDTETEDNLNAVAHRLRGIPHDPSGSITGLDYTLNAETPSRNATSTYVEDGHEDFPPFPLFTRGRSRRRRTPRGFLGNTLDMSSITTSGDTPQINILGGPFTTSPEEYHIAIPSDSFYSSMGAPSGLARPAALPPASATVEPASPTTRNLSDGSTPTQPRQVLEPPPIESIPSLPLVYTEGSMATSTRPIRGSPRSSGDSHSTPRASFSRFQVYDSYYPESPIPRVEKFIFSPTYGFLSYTRLKMEYRAARRMELKRKLKTILTFGLY